MQSIYLSTILSTAIYKVSVLLCGLVIVYMGYRLFLVGVFGASESDSELVLKWGKKMVGLKKAAPGLYFALFGTAILGASVWRGLSFHFGDVNDGIKNLMSNVESKGQVPSQSPWVSPTFGIDAIGFGGAPTHHGSMTVDYGLAKFRLHAPSGESASNFQSPSTTADRQNVPTDQTQSNPTIAPKDKGVPKGAGSHR